METDDIAMQVHKIESYRTMLKAKIDFLRTLCEFLDHCARETSRDDIRMSGVEHQRKMLRQQLGKLILKLEQVEHEVFIAWIELAKELLLRQIDEAFAEADEPWQGVENLTLPSTAHVDDHAIPPATFRRRADLRKWDYVLGLEDRDEPRFTLN